MGLGYPGIKDEREDVEMPGKAIAMNPSFINYPYTSEARDRGDQACFLLLSASVSDPGDLAQQCFSLSYPSITSQIHQSLPLGNSLLLLSETRKKWILLVLTLVTRN